MKCQHWSRKISTETGTRINYRLSLASVSLPGNRVWGDFKVALQSLIVENKFIKKMIWKSDVYSVLKVNGDDWNHCLGSKPLKKFCYKNLQCW